MYTQYQSYLQEAPSTPGAPTRSTLNPATSAPPPRVLDTIIFNAEDPAPPHLLYPNQRTVPYSSRPAEDSPVNRSAHYRRHISDSETEEDTAYERVTEPRYLNEDTPLVQLKAVRLDREDTTRRKKEKSAISTLRSDSTKSTPKPKSASKKETFLSRIRKASKDKYTDMPVVASNSKIKRSTRKSHRRSVSGDRRLVEVEKLIAVVAVHTRKCNSLRRDLTDAGVAHLLPTSLKALH